MDHFMLNYRKLRHTIMSITVLEPKLVGSIMKSKEGLDA